VEEIGLTCAFVCTEDDARVVIQNEGLAAETILNSTICSREKVAEITVRVPLRTDRAAVIAQLEDELAHERAARVCA
jgi:hypothetical protein